MSVYSLSDAALLDAFRAQLGTITDAAVSARLGEDPAAKAERHMLIEILNFTGQATGTPYARGTVVDCERTFQLRWSYASSTKDGKKTDNDALTFGQLIASTVAGTHAWARGHRMRWTSNGVVRDSGYYTGEIEVVSAVPAPTGGP